jgi:RNA polymerase sigma factor (sigma-70 family)
MCLVTDNLPLADRLARRYAKGRGRNLIDLRAAAYLGLTQAARKFVPGGAAAFATYATPRILGAMGDCVRRARWTPRYAYQAGTEWTVGSLAAQVRDRFAGDGRPMALADALAAAPAEPGAGGDAAARVGRALAGLSRAERLVLVLRYGERMDWGAVAPRRRLLRGRRAEHPPHGAGQGPGAAPRRVRGRQVPVRHAKRTPQATPSAGRGAVPGREPVRGFGRVGGPPGREGRRVSQDVPDIVRRMSPWELCAYRRIGGYVPADLLRRIAGGGERIRDEDPSNVAARGPAGRPGNRCKGPVVTNEGDEWATARGGGGSAAVPGEHGPRGLPGRPPAEGVGAVLAGRGARRGVGAGCAAIIARRDAGCRRGRGGRGGGGVREPMTAYLAQADATQLPLADQSVSLTFCSPPYLCARTYGIGAQRDCQTWIDWMLGVVAECCRVTTGLVLVNCAGVTRDWNYRPGPEGLLYRWWAAGGQCWRPAYWHRVGIPGSGGRQWLRADVEYVLAFKGGKGPVPWADNTANGHPPKWGPGGEMSHRSGASGRRVNQWGHSYASGGVGGTIDNITSRGPRPSHVLHVGGNPFGNQQTSVGRRPNGERKPPYFNGNWSKMHTKSLADGTDEIQCYTPPVKANPGNLVKTLVGGGLMGSKLAHENEAPFPEDLAAWFIKGWAPPGGIVLDPFSGSGTTAAVARRLGRVGIGFDLRMSQCLLGRRRLAEPPKEKRQAKKAKPAPGERSLFDDAA